jgi:hypothetical protein
MTTKPTATLRVEWRAERLIVKEITAVGSDGRAVALKVLSVTPDPPPETDPERKLLRYAGKVAVHAELLETCSKHLSKTSPDGARKARKDVRDAIKRLQMFEQLLSRRVMS